MMPSVESAQSNFTLASTLWIEAAALYAFASARSRPVVCFAHVTNQMATVGGDFEKGEANGSHGALSVVSATARAAEDLWQDP